VCLSNSRLQLKLLQQQIEDGKAAAASEVSAAALGHQEQAKAWQQVMCGV
jgi:hypothetical protein